MIALTPGRTCGSCTVCCRIPEIEVLAKPAGTPCRHIAGAACGIYATRPDACARWYCLWRKVGAMPDTLRPDRSGVLFSLESRSPDAAARDGACIVGRISGGLGADDLPDVIEAFAMFAREGSLPVWRASGYRTSLIPGPDASTSLS